MNQFHNKDVNLLYRSNHFEFRDRIQCVVDKELSVFLVKVFEIKVQPQFETIDHDFSMLDFQGEIQFLSVGIQQ